VAAELRLSVLDQTPVSEGSTAAQALRRSIDLAILAERLGYHRYWVAEHHGGGLVAGPSPEALIGPIAAATTGIRVGSGGVMLPHYSPLKVAESFGVLAGLFPGRIDLGIGRAAGTDPMTTQVLQRDRSRPLPDDFPDQLASCSPTSSAASPPATSPASPRTCRAGPRRRSRGCSAPPSRAPSGPANSASATPSPISSTPAGRRSRRPIATASTPAGASPSLASRSPSARSSPRARRRRGAWRRAGAWPSACSAAAV
jgi:hypothetical protein